MQTLGLTSTELQAYHRALLRPHTRRITVEVLDLDGRLISTITPVVLDGQVVVDMDAEVTRSASLSFLDPSHSLNFDTDSPDDGAMYINRMVRIIWTIFVEELNRYISCTVFTGPVTSMSRSTDVVDIEAQGKEFLSVNRSLWWPVTFQKGARKTDAIKSLIQTYCGERSLNIATESATLPAALSYDAFTVPWEAATEIANGMTRQLFYNGEGVLMLRPKSTPRVYTFRTGDYGDIMSEPSISYEMTEFTNAVVVYGPEDAAKRVSYISLPAENHPLSPYKLGRGGRPWFAAELIEDDTASTQAACRAIGDARLSELLMETVQVEFDAIPIPHLDPGDTVAIDSPWFTGEFRLSQFTLPLSSTGDPTMSVGYLRNQSRGGLRKPTSTGGSGSSSGSASGSKTTKQWKLKGHVINPRTGKRVRRRKGHVTNPKRRRKLMGHVIKNKRHRRKK